MVMQSDPGLIKALTCATSMRGVGQRDKMSVIMVVLAKKKSNYSSCLKTRNLELKESEIFESNDMLMISPLY